MTTHADAAMALAERYEALRVRCNQHNFAGRYILARHTYGPSADCPECGGRQWTPLTGPAALAAMLEIAGHTVLFQREDDGWAAYLDLPALVPVVGGQRGYGPTPDSALAEALLKASA